MEPVNKGQSLSFAELYKSLAEHAYVNVPFPVEPSFFDSAVEAFFKFLEEPEPTRQYIHFSIAPLHRRGDVGFVHRNPADHIYNDSKDFFHFHPAIKLLSRLFRVFAPRFLIQSIPIFFYGF